MENESTSDRAWSTISSIAAPPQLLYLDTLRASDFGQFYKRQSFDLLDVSADQLVLDVGCGSGDDVRALAERVGTGGRIMGVDANESLLQEARRRSSGQTLPIEFVAATHIDCRSSMESLIVAAPRLTGNGGRRETKGTDRRERAGLGNAGDR